MPPRYNSLSSCSGGEGSPLFCCEDGVFLVRSKIGSYLFDKDLKIAADAACHYQRRRSCLAGFMEGNVHNVLSIDLFDSLEVPPTGSLQWSWSLSIFEANPGNTKVSHVNEDLSLNWMSGASQEDGHSSPCRCRLTHSVGNPWQMIVNLRNNPPRSQLAQTCIKYREVQTTHIVHKKRQVLTIRYFQKSLRIAIFALWSMWFEPILEIVREGKALKKKPPRSLETVAIFVFLIQECFTGNKLDPDPLILKSFNLFSRAKILKNIVRLRAYIFF